MNDAREMKARRGFVVDGRVYEYESVEMMRENSLSDTRRGGHRLRMVAKDCKERGIAPPRAGKRGTGSWSPGSIHEMFRRGMII